MIGRVSHLALPWRILIFLAMIAVAYVMLFVRPHHPTPYPGFILEEDVVATMHANGDRATDVLCPDSVPKAGLIVDCSATVNGVPTGIRVTWEDRDGHYTIEKEVLAP